MNILIFLRTEYQFLDADPNSGSFQFRIRDQEWKIRIRDEHLVSATLPKKVKHHQSLSYSGLDIYHHMSQSL
jgi:hypothetical protein